MAMKTMDKSLKRFGLFNVARGGAFIIAWGFASATLKLFEVAVSGF